MRSVYFLTVPLTITRLRYSFLALTALLTDLYIARHRKNRLSEYSLGPSEVCALRPADGYRIFFFLTAYRSPLLITFDSTFDCLLSRRIRIILPTIHKPGLFTSR